MEKEKGETNEEFCKRAHAGFTLSCDSCGSTAVIQESDMGYSEESGPWGSVDLVCMNCHARTILFES